jgi:hypothetical protein
MIAALVVVVSAMPTSAAHAEDPFVLRATAGLGGLVKSGRWVPVSVEIRDRSGNAGGHITADLVVSWGDAVVRRRVLLGSGGTRRYDVYVRTIDAASSVRVTLDGHASPVEVPVTVLPFDEPMTLCVGENLPPPRAAHACSLTLSQTELPTSVRALDAVDDVFTAESAPSPAGASRAALNQWQALRALDTFGDLALTPQVTRPLMRRGLPDATSRTIAATATLYAALLVAVGLVTASARLRVSRGWIAFAGVLLAGTGATLLIGKFGPGSAVTIHHTSLVQQLPGADISVVTMRAVAQFPSSETTELRLPIEDAMIEASASTGRAAQVVDPAGYPLLVVDAGLGTRQAFVAEGAIGEQWLTVREAQSTIQVTNRSAYVLRDCHFAEGMSRTAVGELPPGGFVEATRTGEIMGPLFTCTTTEAAVRFDAAAREVAMLGTTTVAAYQNRRGAGRAAEAPND